jgi:hypothetical protein
MMLVSNIMPTTNVTVVSSLDVVMTNSKVRSKDGNIHGSPLDVAKAKFNGSDE